MVAPENLAKLSDEEVELCRKAFHVFDKDGSGTIDVKELRSALQSLGQNPTDEELFVMISLVDEDGSKEIDFYEFQHAIQLNKALSEKNAAEEDTLDAFMALGGNGDGSGTVQVSKLVGILNDFELQVDVSSLVGDERKDMTFEDFQMLFA